MKKETTLIAVVLDCSGSMEPIKADTIGGFNSFLAEQQKQPGEAFITLTQFDDRYDIVYSNQAIKSAPKLTDANYVPRANTALFDAIGRTINDVGSQLRALPEADRPGKVIFVIITDGEENASREYKRDKVFEMITHQRDKYNWEFVYLGANQDAIATATQLGVQASNAAGYTGSGKGTRSAFKAMSTGLTSYRSTVGAQKTQDFFGKGKLSIGEDEIDEDSVDLKDSTPPVVVSGTTKTS